MDEIVNEDIPGWLGLGGGLFTDKLDATALLLKARQYGDEHVKYGQTYGLVNACMVNNETSILRFGHDNYFRISSRS